MAARFFSLALLLVASCGPEAPPPPVSMPIYATDAARPYLAELVALLPTELDAGLRMVADPVAGMASSTEGETRIAVVIDGSEPEGFVLETAEGGFVVRGGAPLGVQYGIAALLEAMDVRFFHPSHAFVPETLRTPDASVFGVMHTPEIAERGLQLHTLHPIESYFDFWRGEEHDFEGARRTLQWMIFQRGNYVTWPALDEIARSAPRRAAWQAHTRRIVELAHTRGMRVGLGMQLFGNASLQRSFVLVPGGADPVVSIPERLGHLGGIPFDAVNLAFGEFSGAEPDAFIDAVELAYDHIAEVLPSAEMTASIHVGNFEDTRVTYMGEEMLYYFLVRFVDRPIIPWIHTVMYFDLFEDAGGAYNHDDYDAHRAYLFDELSAGNAVGYHPETAYWVAFDISIPTYLPIYVRTRHFDLNEIRAAGTAMGAGPLESHVVFSSGWEWGYWQNDVAVLRMSYELPETDDVLFEEMFAPLPGGDELATIAGDLADVQHEHLLVGRLAAYLASTDATFTLGRAMDFWSQPTRPELDEIVLYDAAAQADFETRVVAPLAVLRDETATILARFDASSVIDPSEPFTAEIRDGIEIDVARTDFAHAVFGAALARAAGMPTDTLLAEAHAAHDRARAVVERRRGAMHDPDAATEILSDDITTAGLYQYGYLREADTLCYFDRELAELENALGGDVRVPGCVL